MLLTLVSDNQNAHLLTPAFAHGLVPTPDAVSVSDLEALMLESEADIRAADRDLREVAELESRGVLDAGKLPSECLIDMNGDFHLIHSHQVTSLCSRGLTR